MSEPTLGGTVKPVSRYQILRHKRGQEIFIFPAQLPTSRIGNLIRLVHTMIYVMTTHIYIHTKYILSFLYKCLTFYVDAPSPEGRSRVLREMM